MLSLPPLRRRVRIGRVGGVGRWSPAIVPGEGGTVGGPLEAADLLGVAAESLDGVSGDADVVVHDCGVTAAATEEVFVPAQSSDPVCVCVCVLC